MVVDTFSIELNANIYIFLPIPFSNLLYKYFRITQYCVLRILEQKYISKCFDSMVKLIKMSESREKWSSPGGSDYRLLANLKPKIRSGPDECPICCLGMGGPLLESRVWCSNRCHARPKCERAFPMFQMEPSGGKNSAALHSILIRCLGGSFVCTPVHALKSTSHLNIKSTYCALPTN